MYRNAVRCGYAGTWIALFAAVTMAGADDDAAALQLFRTGKYAECVEAAAKAAARPIAAENPWLLKIRAELELGRYEDAAKSLVEGLKRRPNSLVLRWLARDIYRYNNQPQLVAQVEKEFGQIVEQAPYAYADPVNRMAVARYLLTRGADPKKVLDVIVNEVKKRYADATPAWMLSGEIALDKNDYALAAESFAQAAKIDDTDADAHLGLALAFAPSESEKAEQSLRAALQRNPNHVRSLLLIVDNSIDAERYDEAERTLSQVEGINPQHPLAAAYRAVLAHLRNQPEREADFRNLALKFWRENPEVDHLIGKKLAQKYRFTEGADYQRRALTFDPQYAPARIQFAQDLLRLGLEEEGWKLAADCLRVDAYNVVAHNLIELQSNLQKFRTLEEDGIIARMDARESEVYGRRVLDLLKRARRDLSAKYDVVIDQPIIVEIFPRQQDFAIRTFGLPGGDGFLGVCFGTVITANSPATQAAHPSCWEATLWHEFCHVVTLSKTHNKMPRWLSEGISVYEERQADPAWGQTINPTYRKMLLSDDLTPVSRLSGAFLHSASPLHLQFAYFESSLVVEYLVATHGLDALKAILTDLGAGISVNDALARHTTGSLNELDAKFVEFARNHASTMAPGADWSEPELPAKADSRLISTWLKDHSTNYVGLKRLAVQLMAEKRWDAARERLEELHRLYPADRSGDSHHLLLARLHRETGQEDQERAALEKFAALSADAVEVLSRLTELTEKSGDWASTRKYAQQWLAVAPLQAEPHRRAARAADALDDRPLAVSSYRALLELNPIDAADVHLQLATALQRAGDLAGARRHALLALEDTPRFLAAQRRLLDILREMEAHSADKPAAETTGPALPSR